MSSIDPVGWLAYGGATVLRVTIVMLLAFSVAAALRKRAAAERHLVWQCTVRHHRSGGSLFPMPRIPRTLAGR